MHVLLILPLSYAVPQRSLYDRIVVQNNQAPFI